MFYREGLHLLATYFLGYNLRAKGLAKLNFGKNVFEDFDQPAKNQQFCKKTSERVIVDSALTSERTFRSFFLESCPIHFPASRWCPLMYLISAAFKNKYKTIVPSLRNVGTN